MTNFTDALLELSARVLARCRENKLKLATAESCTGGLLAGLLTEIAGSSDVVERGFVTYSNEAKTEMIGVPASLIAAQGAVSEAVARAMAEGARMHSKAEIGIGITGIAGPGGGSEAKPVGTVHIAISSAQSTRHVKLALGNQSRSAIRLASVKEALDQLLAMFDGRP